VRAALVVANEAADAWIVGQSGSADRRRQHIDRPALGKLGDQRRRENDVAQIARLNNERPAHSVDLQHREKSLLGNLHRSHLLHSFLALLLLLEELALAGDVATIA